jgi:hypothetical protein
VDEEVAPLELAPREDLDAYAELFGLDREMVRLARKCPECEAAILVPDNGVWLDAKAIPAGEWGIMQMGPLKMACAPADGEGGSRHTLHRIARKTEEASRVLAELALMMPASDHLK